MDGKQELRTRWEGGKAHEIDFWRELVATQGGKWPEEYRFRTDPEAPLDAGLIGLVEAATTPLRVLDVGAGPLTILGKRAPNRVVELVAVDALAHEYNRMLTELGVTPIVKTEYCESERLLEQFQADSFDLAHARNTLDHGYQPLEAIRQMIAVTKPGGAIVLSHFANEAEKAAYEGFHQWNFSIEGTALLLWNHTQRIDVLSELGPTVEVLSMSPSGSDYVHVVLRKKR